MSAGARRLVFTGLLVVSCLSVLATPALAQCSMCRQVVSTSPEAQRMSAELNRAILLLFVAPYLVFTTIALALFRAPIGRQVRRVVRIFFLPR
jgi:hypothetical protein